jgi:hypothetical protein
MRAKPCSNRNSKLASYYRRQGDTRRAAEMEVECWRMEDKFHVSRVNLPTLSHSETHRDRKKDGKRADRTRLSLLGRIFRRS